MTRYMELADPPWWRCRPCATVACRMPHRAPLRIEAGPGDRWFGTCEGGDGEVHRWTWTGAVAEPGIPFYPCGGSEAPCPEHLAADGGTWQEQHFAEHRDSELSSIHRGSSR